MRLRHLPSGRVYNVVFSHTQADYPEDSEFHAAERGAQFAQIQKLIEKTLDPLADREQRERVLLMGDLNVSVLTTGTAEWTQLFDTPASFFTKPLYDAWARTTSPQDRGVTNGHEKERLDYVAAFPRPYISGGLEGPMCVQHMTIPTDFQDLESDHYMVHADLNLGFFHCHPQIAYEVILARPQIPNSAPTESVTVDETDGVDVTRIAYPGAIQWFHVKVGQPGTWTLVRNNGQVRARRLSAGRPDYSDIPLQQGHRHVLDRRLHPLRGPISCFLASSMYGRRAQPAHTPAITGSRSSGTHAARRRRPASCSPARGSRPMLTKAGDPIGLQNQAWFRFAVTGTSDSGIDQTITLTADGLTDPNNHKATLQSFTNTNGMSPP